MEIPIFVTSDREWKVEVTATAEEMDIQSEDFSLEDGVRVACTEYRNGDLVRVEGEASATLTVPCARCLEPSQVKVCGPFSFVVNRMPLGVALPEGEEEAEEGEEEFIFVEHTATSIDITAFVRDAIILALPLRVLCREDCKGLCVVCGKNRNEGECGCETRETDPRWRALAGTVPENRKKQ